MPRPSPPQRIIGLANIATEFATTIILVVTFTLFYGLLILLFSHFTIKFLRKEAPTRAQRIVFLASCVSFFLATVSEGAVIARISILAHSVFFEYQDIPMADKLHSLYDDTRTPDVIFIWATSFEVIISDGIVVWRAYVLLQNKRWLIAAPVFLLLLSTVMYLIPLISMIITSETTVLINSTCASAIGLSLGTNIVSTSLIGYIYWLHREDMLVWFSNRKRRTQGERALATLAESGIVFCLFQVAFFALEFPSINDPGRRCAEKLFKTIYFGFVAIYPTLMVALVNNQCTFDHASFSLSLPQNGDPSGGNRTFQPISFATPTLDTPSVVLDTQTKASVESQVVIQDADDRE